jgi:hypothetical protein
MLLSNDGSEGLDLSFVTHIFFLEEVWDKSLAEQAVARAWRMGAKGRVEVETLVAKNSVEATMQEFELAVNERSRERRRLRLIAVDFDYNEHNRIPENKDADASPHPSAQYGLPPLRPNTRVS